MSVSRALCHYARNFICLFVHVPFYLSRLSASEYSISKRKSVLWNPFVPLPICFQIGVRLIFLLSLFVSTCSSTYLVHVHLFSIHLFPTHLFVLPTVSNFIFSSPTSIQVHQFLRPSISKSTYSYTALFLNPTNVFESIYLYIHPYF